MVNKIQLRKIVGGRLRKIRDSRSLSQEKMARHLGTGRPNYSRIEIGDTFPNHFIMHRLAYMFDISLDWLVCGKGPMLYLKKRMKSERQWAGNSQGPDSSEYLENPDLEMEELLGYMEQIPLLHHEIMEVFFKFKIVNKELIEAANKQRDLETADEPTA
jgi:transcriptional regulator with XRE-family HTH domain